MKVNELIAELSQMPQEMDVIIVGIFDADEIKKGEEWTADENIREVESDDFDVWIEDVKRVVIQFHNPKGA